MIAYKKPTPSLIGVLALTLVTLLTAGAIGVNRLDLRSRASFSGNNADVIVVGAGTGGVAAAIAAARSGANVILIEETDWIGGQMTAAGVTSMDGGNASWTGGIYKEFIEKVNSYYTKQGKSVGTCYFSPSTVCFEPHIGKNILTAMIAAEPTISLRLRTKVLQVTKAGSAIAGLTINENSTSKQLTAPVVIDATEYGDIIMQSGAPYRIGNGTNTRPNTNACIQDITYTAVLKKYPNGVPQNLRITTPPPGYTDDIKSIFRSIVTKDGKTSWNGAYPVSWPIHNAYRGMPDSTNPVAYNGTMYSSITKTGVNWANDYPRNAYTPASTASFLSTKYLTDRSYRTQINCEAKLRTMQFLYYVQNELGESQWSISTDEGFNTTYNREENSCDNIPASLKAIEQHFPVFPYVRESVRGVGPVTLTARDMKRTGTPARATKTYQSSIAIGDYPNDLHGCNSTQYLETEMEQETDVSGSGPFQIPMETLYSLDVPGLIFAEKNISVSRLANGAIRLQPITMLTGQAAGTLAAVAAKRHIPPGEVSVTEVQRILTENKSSLVPFTDVSLAEQAFPVIQQIAARGILIGPGNLRFDPDGVLLRGQTASAIIQGLSLAKQPPQSATFTDVSPDHPNYAAIESMYALGITVGCNTTPREFCPNMPTSHSQLAILLLRSAQILDGSFVPVNAAQPTFSDVPKTHQGYSFIEGLAAKGIVIYCDGSTKKFCPDSPIPRKSAARLIGAVLATVHTNATASPIPTATPIAYSIADFTADGKVTIADYTLFMNYWATGDIAHGDLNHDGRITVVDYTLFMNEWNRFK